MINVIKDIFGTIPLSKRRVFFFLQALVLLMSLFELIGVALIVPFFTILTEPELIESSSMLLNVKDYFNISGNKQLLIYLGISLIGVITLSSILSIYTNWKLLLYTYSIGAYTSNKLYAHYLRLPWMHHANNSSSEMISYATIEVDRFVGNILSPFSIITSRVFIAILIIGALIIYEPIIIIFGSLIFSALYFSVFFFIKNILEKNSEIQVTSLKERFKQLNEGLGGIKEIILRNNQSEFISKYSSSTDSAFKYRGINGALVYVPRYYLELLAYGALIGFALISFYTDKDGTQLLQSLSIFAVASIKLLPAIHQIFYNVGTIQGSIKSLEVIKEEVGKANNAKKMDVEKTHKKIHFLNKLAFKNVFFKYPLHERKVLNNVTFEIKKGEVIGVAGSSGSGKTTIADLILGLINPTKGLIQIDDQILGSENLLSWQEMLSYVPQNTFILEGSIKENITFGSNDETENSKNLLNDAIDKAGLREFIESLPKGVETEVGEKGYMISGGQKQRIGIARAFYNKSKFIIFDEATNAQDNITEAEILKSIFDHKDKFTFLIIAHRLSTLENCDNILFLKNGEISDSGNFNKLKETSKEFKAMLETKKQ